jgi:hypothetical protein
MLLSKKFAHEIHEVFKDQYLKQLTKGDFHYQYEIIPSDVLDMFVSLNCMHYKWEKCHITLKCQVIDKIKDNSIIIEPITNKSLCI